ncbi:hypothetical protein D3C76_1190210 [compost metagenome]
MASSYPAGMPVITLGISSENEVPGFCELSTILNVLISSLLTVSNVREASASPMTFALLERTRSSVFSMSSEELSPTEISRVTLADLSTDAGIVTLLETVSSTINSTAAVPSTSAFFSPLTTSIADMPSAPSIANPPSPVSLLLACCN